MTPQGIKPATFRLVAQSDMNKEKKAGVMNLLDLYI